MWLLIIATCIAGQAAPACGSGLSPIHDPAFAACEDAAVRSHDQMRAIAQEAGLTVLLLDTRCLHLAGGSPE